MPKTCKADGCKWDVWGGGYCKNHQYLRDKRPKRPKFRSDKRAEQEAQYSIDRRVFLDKPENQFCAVYPWLESTQVHHMKGKIGDLLLDQRWWLGVSDEGHKKIESEPLWAKEEGYSLSRLS